MLQRLQVAARGILELNPDRHLAATGIELGERRTDVADGRDPNGLRQALGGDAQPGGKIGAGLDAQLWPVEDDASDTAKNNAKQRTATLRYLIRDADTQKAIKGTRWAGYQAITEYLDHFAPAKTDVARATRALTGTGAELKSRAFELLAV